MRAIQCCVCVALLLMTASAVPASSKADAAKIKKTTTIASGGERKNASAITAATTTASRPTHRANATLHSSTTTATAPKTAAAAATSAATTLKLPTASSTTIATPVRTTTARTAAAAASSSSSSSSLSSASSTTSLPTSRNPQQHGGVSSGPVTYITETSPRIISPTQHTAATVLSSRKSAASATAAAVVDVTTTPPLTAKETRESPGKIRPQIKLTTNYTTASETGVRLPEGASAALEKPTKYHYYPHNQHIYLLPECAVQQVCNAVYVRLNFTQPLCACPGRYRDPCSASLDSDDLHTTELVTDPRTKALTLVKTCEPVAEMRECRASRDWSLLALQNVRTGKSHYLVICRCPDTNILEGPMSHDQPTYASVPGIRVYGMMCVQGNRRGRPLRYSRSVSEQADNEEKPRFPWDKVRHLMATPSVWE
ncbi:mucin-5AC [Monomorium pharaonis]|uniref:mucin-5AC n=1 Tax=Monomorium pharaonis TaxID=307658 RepID=UPI00063F380F|nr:mucin-5AC [Monomorium pharaonis]